MAEWGKATGPGLSRTSDGCYPREGPRQAGAQQALQHRPGRHCERRTRHSGACGPAGAAGRGIKYWFRVLTEIKNRSVEDVCIAVCEVLKGLPEATTQSVSRRRSNVRDPFDPQHLPLPAPPALGRVLPGSQACLHRSDRGNRQGSVWGVRSQVADKVPVSCGSGIIPGLSFAPFPDWVVEIRRVICSTNAIDLLNARYRRAVRTLGHFSKDARSPETSLLPYPLL